MALTSLWVFIFLLLLAVWLLGVSIWLFRISNHYARLTHGMSDTRDLRQILEDILLAQKDFQKNLDATEEHIQQLSRKALDNIQKVGLVRFNPFGDTGGDQSFAMALLDGNDSGVVILGLHGRETTRIYVKDIKNGVAEHSLSKEETQAIEKARQG